MITLNDKIVFDASREKVWSLLNDFEKFAKCIPTLKEYVIDGNTAEGIVGVTLGAVPIESKIQLTFKINEEGYCIVANGVSYLGETIQNIKKNKDKPIKINNDSVGKFDVMCVLFNADGKTSLVYEVKVNAEGKLQKIYESIIRLKLPAMQQEFYEKFSSNLDDVVILSPKPKTLLKRLLEKLMFWRYGR